jgi:periplasmic divalent cation tolerance protein
MSFITIYITNPSEAAAEKIAEHLLRKNLVACANIYPIKSMYWWKGELQKDSEWVALVKTTSELWDLVRTEIEKEHPYEVPCIMKTDVEANEAYEEWVRGVIVGR